MIETESSKDPAWLTAVPSQPFASHVSASQYPASGTVPADGVLCIAPRFLFPAVFLGIIAAAYAAAITVKHCSRSIKFFIMGICSLYLIMMTGISFYTVNMYTMEYGMDGVYQSDATYLGKHAIENPRAMFDGLLAQRYINENYSAS